MPDRPESTRQKSLREAQERIDGQKKDLGRMIAQGASTQDIEDLLAEMYRTLTANNAKH